MWDSTTVGRVAVSLLAGAGKTDGEWWYYGSSKVAHLRVGITDVEGEMMWPGGDVPVATADAGEEGKYRARTMEE